MLQSCSYDHKPWHSSNHTTPNHIQKLVFNDAEVTHQIPTALPTVPQSERDLGPKKQRLLHKYPALKAASTAQIATVNLLTSTVTLLSCRSKINSGYHDNGKIMQRIKLGYQYRLRIMVSSNYGGLAGHPCFPKLTLVHSSRFVSISFFILSWRFATVFQIRNPND